MSGKVRYALAAAFVGLLFLIPDADMERLAYLQIRAWLTAEEGPLEASFSIAAEDEKRKGPALRVSFAKGPANRAEKKRRANLTNDYERIARTWARGRRYAIDASRPPTQLHIYVSETGFRSYFDAVVDGHAVQRVKELHRDSPDGYLPDRWSLLPAFAAILFAILTGKVILALLLGGLAGAFLYRSNVMAAVEHLAVDTIWTKVVLDDFNIYVMAFVVFLFMSIGVMTRAGGLQGMVALIRKFAKGPVSSQLCSYAVGLLIFFDDYANCIITGTTMRPLTDRNRVSREKLAYIVDSTAAPIAGISIFSTWVAYEVSMFQWQLPEVTHANGSPFAESEGFSVFIQTLPFRFYCVFTLAMVLLTIVLRREFGPMLAAERRAAAGGRPFADDAKPIVTKGFEELAPNEDTVCSARMALVPIGLLVVMTVTLLFVYGHVATPSEQLVGVGLMDRLQIYLAHTRSQNALFWSSLIALIVASGMALARLTPREVVVSALASVRSLGLAVIILILAWTIGRVCADVGTGEFLTAALGDQVDWTLPAVLFLVSALVAFSTGSSFGTMAILLPNVVVLAHGVGGTPMMLLTIGAVLEGSIFGDHCSPVSDTTVLSSAATGSDHLHHVRTQAPYAVLVMIVALLFGYLPMAWLGPEQVGYWFVSWIAGVGAIATWLMVVARSPVEPEESPGSSGGLDQEVHGAKSKPPTGLA